MGRGRWKLPSVVFNKEDLKRELQSTGCTIAELAEQIGYNRVTISHYINKGVMPKRVMDKINKLIGGIRPEEPKTKKIWVRLGVIVPISKNELLEILKDADYDEGYGFRDYEISGATAARWMKDAISDGGSYIPGCSLDIHREFYEMMTKQKKQNERPEETDIPESEKSSGITLQFYQQRYNTDLDYYTGHAGIYKTFYMKNLNMLVEMWPSLLENYAGETYSAWDDRGGLLCGGALDQDDLAYISQKLQS